MLRKRGGASCRSGAQAIPGGRVTSLRRNTFNFEASESVATTDAHHPSADFRPPHSLTLTKSNTAVAETKVWPEQVNIPTRPVVSNMAEWDISASPHFVPSTDVNTSTTVPCWTSLRCSGSVALPRTLLRLSVGEQPSVKRTTIQPRGAAALPQRAVAIEHRPDARLEFAGKDRLRVVRVTERARKAEFGSVHRCERRDDQGGEKRQCVFH